MAVHTKKYGKCHIVMKELRKLTEVGKPTKNYDKLMRYFTRYNSDLFKFRVQSVISFVLSF